MRLEEGLARHARRDLRLSGRNVAPELGGWVPASGEVVVLMTVASLRTGGRYEPVRHSRRSHRTLTSYLIKGRVLGGSEARVAGNGGKPSFPSARLAVKRMLR